MDIVNWFDYWSFHDDGSTQFFQVKEGELVRYQEFDPGYAPILHINERTFNPGFAGPVMGLRYHGRSYVAEDSATE